jgi:hypothetical protein
MSVEKNQLFKVGDKVKILPTILSSYNSFPYVGKIGRVCNILEDIGQIGVEFSCPNEYFHTCGGRVPTSKLSTLKRQSK